MSTFKPLLAAALEEKDFDKLKFPLYASVKLDGIRVLVIDGVVYSRSLKPIRSKAVQELFGKAELNGIDGEIIYGAWNDSEVLNKTTQAVMSKELPEGFEKSEFRLVAFDLHDSNYGYFDRLSDLYLRTRKHEPAQVTVLTQKTVHTIRDILDFEKEVLDIGYEGVMLRAVNGTYKQGRSTLKEQILIKLKRFSEGEGELIEIIEATHNINEAKINELGYTERSTSKDGLVPAGMVGTLLCRDLSTGEIIRVGPGKMKHQDRKLVFNNPKDYLSKIVKYKHFEYGAIDAPRFAGYVSWRDEEDMSE